MSSLEVFAESRIAELEDNLRKRELKETVRSNINPVLVEREGKKLISFSCNDYLGLSHHPSVLAVAKAALLEYGAGSSASQLVTGYSPLIKKLEQQLSAYNFTEDTCLFGSGYLANIGVIQALVSKGDMIIADRLIHACALDGARLSGADFIRFTHNSLENCEQLLINKRNNFRHCLLIIEHVYSMDGDVAPIKGFIALAKKYDAWLLVDNAHGLGVLPPHYGDYIHMGTFSKGLGSYGAYISGNKKLIEYLRSAARSLMFSTSLPPSSLGAASTALEIIIKEPERSAKVLSLARKFTEMLNLPLAQSAIVPLIIGEESLTLEYSNKLIDSGFLVSAIRPPTVPANSSRLRFSFNAEHSGEMVDDLVNAVIRVQKELLS